MQTITFAIPNINDTAILTELPREIIKDDYRILIHSDPIVIQDGYSVKKNFDLIYGLYSRTYTVINSISKNTPDKNIPHFKEHSICKHSQFVKLTHILNDIYRDNPTLNKLILPRVFISEYLIDVYGTFINNFEDSGLPKKVLLKPVFGARGCSHALVPIELLHNFILDTTDLSVTQLREKYPDVVISEPYLFTIPTDKKEFQKLIKETEDNEILGRGERYMINEYMEDVESEYRVVSCDGTTFVRKRSINGVKGYKQANLSQFIEEPKLLDQLNSPYNKFELIENTDLPKIVSEVISKLDSLLLAIDIFKTKDGKFGVFEYQSQFGTETGFTPEIIKTLQDGIYRRVIKKYESLKNKQTILTLNDYEIK